LIPDQIERDILIEAPVETVWRILTEPDEMVKWFAARIDFAASPGAEGGLTFSTTGRSWTVEVEAVEPPRRFTFRWRPVDDERPPERTSMHVEFTLRAEAGGTRLRVVESGFDGVDWSDEEKARYAEDHGRGWIRCLDQLRALAAE